MAYLDHAGATLPSDEQLKQICHQISTQSLANPHSAHSAASTTRQIVENARLRVLRHFGTTSEKHAVIWTSGTTAALTLLADSIRLGGTSQGKARVCRTTKEIQHGTSTFGYLLDSHHSVVGMRERMAVDEILACDWTDLENYANAGDSLRTPISNKLFVLTAMSNFSGAKYSPSIVGKLQEKGWLVCLDAACLVSSGPLNLDEITADFVAISFYKMFGYPTGLGALIVRREAEPFLRPKSFGGGSVSGVLAGERWHSARPEIEARFELGTLNFQAIATLQFGFDDLERRGGMEAINSHTTSIAKSCYEALSKMTHENGVPLVHFYSACPDPNSQGPILTFNLMRNDRTWVGYSEVTKLADLWGVSLRVGCFCNQGACQQVLGISDAEIRRNHASGKKCGDEVDLNANGQPIGAVRVSFGRMSTEQDVKILLDLLDACWLAGGGRIPVQKSDTSLAVSSAKLAKIFLYPVKSMRAVEVNSWPTTPSGLMFDRAWMVASKNGVVATQKRVPAMCSVIPAVKLDENRLELRSVYEGDALKVDLQQGSTKIVAEDAVCETTVKTSDCGDAAANWLEDALDLDNIRLRRICTDSNRSLSNEAAYLLVNSASAAALLAFAEKVDTKLSVDDLVTRFRPNLVLRGAPAWIEERAKRVSIDGTDFDVVSKCTRCEMICIDPETGEKDPNILLALRDFRRGRQITFGVYLRQTNPAVSTKLHTGASISFEFDN